METQQLRKRLHDYIDQADSNVIEAIYTILKNDIEGDRYSPEFISEMYKRRKAYQNHPSENFTVEESLQLIRQSKATDEL